MAGTGSISLPSGEYTIVLTGGENINNTNRAQSSQISGVITGSVSPDTSQTYYYKGSGTINFSIGKGAGIYTYTCGPTTPGATNCQFGQCSCHDGGDGSISIKSIY